MLMVLTNQLLQSIEYYSGKVDGAALSNWPCKKSGRFTHEVNKQTQKEVKKQNNSLNRSQWERHPWIDGDRLVLRAEYEDGQIGQCVYNDE